MGLLYFNNPNNFLLNIKVLIVSFYYTPELGAAPSRITNMAEGLKAKGADVISLGIGDPDTPTLPPVVEAMHEAIDNPANHDYPPYNGTASFRKTACEWMKNRFGVELDADTEMLANIGSKEAIAHVFFAFVDKGDYTYKLTMYIIF